jgi:endonuclease/exonuclease/phosphatase family metal-dependent hydrolase
VACFVPYIQSENFSFLSFLGLVVPALVLANIFFLVYWAVQGKRKLYGSLLTLFISYLSLGPFYKWSAAEQEPSGDLKVMTYNVRSFNRYEELPSKTVLTDIKAFVKKENPDVICIQEPFYNSSKEFENYPFRYLEYFHMQGKGLLAIFSKYPILETGLLNLPRTDSNGVFVDVQYHTETIRVYNIHLESLGITPGQGVLTKEPTDKLFQQVNHAFQKQMEQAEVIRSHLNSSPHKNILCGDFNNGQYSNVYRTIKGNLQDTFLEAGTGYGRTYLFHGLPFRIDFILADEAFEVKSHANYDVPYSDHFPVMASFEWRSE